MGSDSDAPVMQPAADLLRELGIACEMTVASAHRSPARVQRLVAEAPGRGVKVFIVGAGAAAHLAGMVAAHTTPPGHRRADRFVRTQGARRAALHRADAARRAGGDGVDREARRDQCRECSPRR